MHESRILFEDDMEADPYSVAIDLLKVVLDHALSNEGSMNDTELAHLHRIDHELRGPQAP